MWDEPRAPNPPRRTWPDRALVAVCAALVVLEVLVRAELPHRMLWAVVALAILPTLLWRRTRPLPMVSIAFAVSAAGTVLAGGEQSGLFTLAVMLLLPFALLRWGSGREIVLGMAIVPLSTGFSMAVSHLAAADVAGAAIVLFAVTTLGVALRYRARAKARELDQVKLIERERLARDLHDSVAHHVSAMAIRAQAGLATAAARPDAAIDALRLIEAEATRALREMRAMVHMLRADGSAPDAVLSPGPGIGDVAELAREAGHGPPVDVEIRGETADLSAAVGTAVYRLAQESVTNALRHARNASRVRVRVETDGAAVCLIVTDDGDPTRGLTSPGYGLLGMRERAALLGGTCEAGPRPGGGWRVRAVLPITQAPR